MNEHNELSTAVETAVAPPRTLEMIGAEIRTFTASMLNNIIEIGRRMCEAKELLPYGRFGDWIKAQTGYSTSTANNFMRLYQEYGAAQGSLFGATVEDAQTFGNLSYTKALALLALPAGEREEFVETHDVGDMSTRELREAIRERDEARADAEQAKRSAKVLENQVKALKDDNAAMEQNAGRLLDERDVLQERVKELESRPAPESDPAEIRKAVDEALKKAEAESRTEVDKLKKKLVKLEKKAAEVSDDGEADALRQEADEAKAEVERLQKALAMSGEALVTFRLRFDAWQKAYNEMRATLEQVPEEQRGNCEAAVKAVIGAWS